MKPYIFEITLQAPIAYVYQYLCDADREIANKTDGNIIESAYDTTEPGGHMILAYQVDQSLAIVREVTTYLEKTENKSIISKIEYQRYSIIEKIHLEATTETSTKVRLEYEPKPDGFYTFTTFGFNRLDAKRMAQQLCGLRKISIRNIEDLYLRTRSTYAPFPVRYRVSKEEMNELLKQKKVVRV